MAGYSAVQQDGEEIMSTEMQVVHNMPRHMFKDDELKEAVKELEQDEYVFFRQELRSAIPSMFCATLWMIFAQVATFLAVKFTATCSVHGQATYPMWLLGLLMLIGSVRLVLEWKALKKYLPWYVWKAVSKGKPPFELMGLVVNAGIWLSAKLSFSSAGIADVSTDSGFVATTLKSLSCPDQQLSKIWEETMSQSMFAKLPFAWIDLSVLVVGFWMLSFFQMVYPIIQYAGKPHDEYEHRWSTYLQKCGCDTREYIYADEPYGALAEASGMATIQGLAINQRSLEVTGHPLDIEYIAVPLAKQVLVRVLLSYVMENAVQLNLQSSLFAMNAYLSKKKMTSAQYQALLSIGMGLCLSLLKVLEVKSFFDFIKHDTIKKAKTHPWTIRDGNDKTLDRLTLAIGFCSLILVVSLFYSMVKIAAAFICKDSMFNLTGCVELNM